MTEGRGWANGKVKRRRRELSCGWRLEPSGPCSATSGFGYVPFFSLRVRSTTRTKWVLSELGPALLRDLLVGLGETFFSHQHTPSPFILCCACTVPSTYSGRLYGSRVRLSAWILLFFLVSSPRLSSCRTSRSVPHGGSSCIANRFEAAIVRRGRHANRKVSSRT